MISKIIIRLIEGILIVLWAIIGPIFWLPFLTRMVAMFVGTLLVASGSEGNMEVAQIGLDRAARFYSNGFMNIYNSMSAIANETINKKATQSPIEDFWKPLAIHLLFAAVFWFLTLVAIVTIVSV